MSPTWPAFWLSVRIAAAATALTMAVSIPLAYILVRLCFRGRSLIEGLVMLPLVLPPTVVGYFLITCFGAQGYVGRWFNRLFDYSIMFRFEGAVLAAAIVAVPMLYIPAKAAFASIERELEDQARSMGANPLQLFWHVSVPLARRGLLGGILLAFARAMGEFGATIMVFGWRPNQITLPISIYSDFEQGHLGDATPAVVLLSILSLALIMFYNWSSAGKQD